MVEVLCFKKDKNSILQWRINVAIHWFGKRLVACLLDQAYWWIETFGMILMW